ncbi:MAG TPA: GGDEF domain-containing protein [Candidatus Acidoferrales bacterium]|nr:GGDEF domain-containing protein [Candidatus Acidoferrales bacterium]
MTTLKKLGTLIRRIRWVFAFVGVVGSLGLLSWLRGAHYSFEPMQYVWLSLFGSLLILTFAANALVRFRGTHDRISLILALGFALAALVEAGGNYGLYSIFFGGATLPTNVPLPWMVSRTLLGVLLLLALVVERRLPNSREPGREIAFAFLIVGGTAYVTSAAFLSMPWRISIHSNWFIARPWELVPAVLFLAAGLGFRQRLRRTASAFDKALCWTAWLNVACHVAASQSELILDGPSLLAQLLKVASYGILLGGALVDNARLFDQVRRMAITDPLTGLANYRTLVNALQNELERSRRSGRPFAVVLFDLDGLKSVNDQFGHLVGSRAICRLANVLRMHCRSTDTGARYGGDEFALVLPEAGAEAAERVARRVREKLASDPEIPQLSVSAGVAVYPQDGDSLEKLLGAADRALYRMKGRGDGLLSFARIAVCL